MARERARLLSEANTAHGMSRTPTWSSWRGTVVRCTVPVYGAADSAVRIDADWVGPGGFERFLEHLGERPEGTALRRLSDEGDYVPGNVKWMTHEEQLATR